jgi:hypothetical protein
MAAAYPADRQGGPTSEALRPPGGGVDRAQAVGADPDLRLADWDGYQAVPEHFVSDGREVVARALS